MNLAFPKPKDVKKKPVAVREFAGGREVCNLLCKEGRDEYMRRKRVKHGSGSWEFAGIWRAKALRDTTADHSEARHGWWITRCSSTRAAEAVHWICNTKRDDRIARILRSPIMKPCKVCGKTTGIQYGLWVCSMACLKITRMKRKVCPQCHKEYETWLNGVSIAAIAATSPRRVK